jgi:hypothetical protein
MMVNASVNFTKNLASVPPNWIQGIHQTELKASIKLDSRHPPNWIQGFHQTGTQGIHQTRLRHLPN